MTRDLDRLAALVARAAYDPTTGFLTAEILEQTGLRLLQLAGDLTTAELGVNREEAKRVALLMINAAEEVDRLSETGRTRPRW